MPQPATRETLNDWTTVLLRLPAEALSACPLSSKLDTTLKALSVFADDEATRWKKWGGSQSVTGPSGDAANQTLSCLAPARQRTGLATDLALEYLRAQGGPPFAVPGEMPSNTTNDSSTESKPIRTEAAFLERTEAREAWLEKGRVWIERESGDKCEGIKHPAKISQVFDTLQSAFQRGILSDRDVDREILRLLKASASPSSCARYMESDLRSLSKCAVHVRCGLRYNEMLAAGETPTSVPRRKNGATSDLPEAHTQSATSNAVPDAEDQSMIEIAKAESQELRWRGQRVKRITDEALKGMMCKLTRHIIRSHLLSDYMSWAGNAMEKDQVGEDEEEVRYVPKSLLF